MEFLIITTSISLGFLFFGLAKKLNWAIAAGIICTIVVGLFGWFMLGILTTWSTKTTQVKGVVTKSPTTVFVEVNSKTYEFTSHEDYTTINDSTTTFFVEQDYNLYGYQRDDVGSRRLIYKNPKKK